MSFVRKSFPVGLVHTHAHLDHFLAAGEIRRQTGAPIWLHRDDELLWKALPQQCRAFCVPYTPQPDPDHWLEHEQLLECGGSCIHTPGHTPGCLLHHRGTSNVSIACICYCQQTIRYCPA